MGFLYALWGLLLRLIIFQSFPNLPQWTSVTVVVPVPCSFEDDDDKSLSHPRGIFQNEVGRQGGRAAWRRRSELQRHGPEAALAGKVLKGEGQLGRACVGAGG